MRSNNRAYDELRKITIVRNYTKHAEGSVLVSFGDTKVLCTASVVSGVPRFLKDSGQGWVTAEYGMLPRATNVRTDREASKGKQTGRTMEIQRLIGRALRQSCDLKSFGENTITIDCDVIQADGGTRTAAITGGCVALADAIAFLNKKLKTNKCVFRYFVAAVSVGICDNTPMLDLDYEEDCRAQTDMNIVMNDSGEFIELQGTAEHGTFSKKDLDSMLDLAKKGIKVLLAEQKLVLGYLQELL